MKLTIKTTPRPRLVAAMLRHCLTGFGVPDECPIRKCHRDRFCAGPLLRAEGDRLRLARADAADVASDDLAMPLCYMHLTGARQDGIDRALAEGIRVIVAEPGTDIYETTRVLSARSWRRLRGVAR